METPQFYPNSLSPSEIDSILNLPNVIQAKQKINQLSSGSISFSIPLTPSIQSLLLSFNLNIPHLTSLPMRWMKGDSLPHIDHGAKSFHHTYLTYLTNSPGQLILGNQSYPISQGSSYIFPEGLHHETINTGLEPRLLLGPMSEEGFAVGGGSSITGNGGTTIYIRQNSGTMEYSNDNVSWNTFVFPCVIVNTAPLDGFLKINFTTDINVYNSYDYFICNSEKIQFGSEYLNNDGSIPAIIIDGVSNYEGFIENGNVSTIGLDSIYVFNLKIRSINGSTLANGYGWLGRPYFGKSASNNYIVNCSSTGDISDDSGGILGSYAAYQASSLQVIGCSSSGTIGINAGGILGLNSAYNASNVTCEQCWSTGAISQFGGGIFGKNIGENSGTTIQAIQCYSTGTIGQDAGGISGSLAGTTGDILISKCYSLGNIATDGGGIFGRAAASDGGSTLAINCYSAGTITTSGNGIYATNKQSGAIQVSCYAANGSWSISSANSSLTGTPSPIIGSTWVATIFNQPYELFNMGYTPYTIQNIILSSSPYLNNNTIQSTTQGDPSSPAIVSGKSYTILATTGGNPSSYNTISINSTTGAISTTSSTIPDVYTLYIRNIGSYNITSVTLTVAGTGPIPCLTENTLVLTPNGYVPVQHLHKGDSVITSDLRNVKITGIFRTISQGNKHSYPYLIPKNSLAPNYPPIDTRISGDHLIYFQNRWIHPRLSKLFERDTTANTIPYYHVQLKNYGTDNLVINGGMIVESFAGFNNPQNQYINRQRMFNVKNPSVAQPHRARHRK